MACVPLESLAQGHLSGHSEVSISLPTRDLGSSPHKGDETGAGAGRWERGSRRERRHEAHSTGARPLWSDAGCALGAEYQPSRAVLVSSYQGLRVHSACPGFPQSEAVVCPL